tara:strand:+ start:1250 stop:1636 length:387 start_codon:yes stop_codon:yes gene_type:complete
MEEKENYERKEIFSSSVRAGRRTYFFDVRSTKAEDYYMTITESKKFSNEDGSAHYKKHKIYLYKEDFDEFKKSFEEVSDFIFEKKGREVISNQQSTSISNSSDPESNNEDEGAPDTNAESSDVKFEDM